MKDDNENRLNSDELMSLISHYHDCLKEHPFLLNFDESLFNDFSWNFQKLLNYLNDWRYHSDHKTNSTPQEAILKSIYHETSAIMYKPRFMSKLSENVGHITMFIMLVHQIINKEFESSSVRNPTMWYGFKACFVDGEWKVKFEVNEKNRERAISYETKLLDYFAKRKNKEIYQKALNDIEEEISRIKSGETETKYFIFY